MVFCTKETNMIDFHYNTQNAKIQGLSIQVGELFAKLYRNSDPEIAVVQSRHALEAYKSLRRLLPREYQGAKWSRHIGATAAHKATQSRFMDQSLMV